MDPERKLVGAKVSLLLDYPFWGYLAAGLILERKEKLNPPTMATDGMRLYWHPEFVNNTPTPELQGVIVHELYHCILLHIPRRQNRNPKKWNYAADYAVNDLVVNQDKFPLPKGCLLDKAYANQHVEAIYNQLPEPQEQSGGGGTLDSHEEWEQWGKDGDGQGKDPGTAADMEQKWAEAVAQAANQARMSRGSLPGHLDELVGATLQPKLDWKAILRDMVQSCAKNDYTMSPPNKRHLYRGIYLPSITGEEIKVAVAVDTSGSVPKACVDQALSEVNGVCNTYSDYTIHLMGFDTRVHSCEELHPMDPMPKIRDTAGGTDFRPVFEEVTRRQLDITSLVVMTDLYGTFPEKPPRGYHTIWISTSELVAPFGTTIKYPHMKD